MSTQLKKDELLRIHREQLDRYQDTYNNDRHSLQLIELFGGINHVLTVLLSSDNLPLDHKQLQQIHEIITEPATSNHVNVQITDEDDEASLQWTYVFHTTNTYIHSQLGNEAAEKIHSLIFNRYFWAVFLPFCLFAAAPWSTAKTSVAWHAVHILAWTAVLVLILFTLSFANIRCFKLIVTTFDFWMKLFYATKRSFWSVLYSFYVNDHMDALETILAVLVPVVTILLITMIGSLDALRIPLGIKVAFTTAAAVIFTYYAVLFFLDSYADGTDPSVVHVPLFNAEMSLFANMANCYQILAIFIWKQAIFSWMRRNKCTLIKYTPFVKWTDDTGLNVNSESNLISTVQMDAKKPLELEERVQDEIGQTEQDTEKEMELIDEVAVSVEAERKNSCTSITL